MVSGVTAPSRARQSGSHVVYLELKRQILDLELEPGQRLYEPALAASLDVSRTPLREAIGRLVAENLLEPQPTGGVSVPRLDAKEIKELYDVRALLEGLTAAEATRNATPADLDAMATIVERNAALVHLADDALAAGKALHAKILDVADNTWAVRLHDQVSSQMQRYRVFTNHTQQRREAALADHRAILQVITEGDPERARSVVQDHVLSARDAAIRAIGGQLT